METVDAVAIPTADININIITNNDVRDGANATANPDTAALATTTSDKGLNAVAAPATAKDTTGKFPRDHLDVHVLVQGNIWIRRWVKRILLCSLDHVFQLLDDHDTAFRQEPDSIKKMKQGDATWTTSKVTLGWVIDTTAKTITLPPHRIDRLRKILESIAPDQRTIATKDWHKVLGELRSMSIAFPGSVGLFLCCRRLSVVKTQRGPV